MRNPIIAFATAFATAHIVWSQSVAPAAVVEPGAAEASSVTEPSDSAMGNMDEIDFGETDDTHVSLSNSSAQEGFVSIDCEDATIGSVLAQFRRTVKANIVTGSSSNLQNRVSMTLTDKPWVDALSAVLKQGHMSVSECNGIYVVADEIYVPDPKRSRSFKLNHASADELATLLNSSLAERDKTGKPLHDIATVFRDANVVVVTANEKTLAEAEKIIETVDKAPPQVYIEARFIELSSEAMHDLGVKWDSLKKLEVGVRNLKAGFENNGGKAANYGLYETQRTSNNNLTDSINNTDTSSINDSGDSKTSSSSINGTSNNNSTRSDNSTFTRLIANTIGAAEGAGASAASMGWKNAHTFSGQLTASDFSLALSAFEQVNDAKMFSNPRIIVSNGKVAKVDMTTKYPNVTVQASRSSGLSEALDISTRIEVIPGEDKFMFAKEAFFSWGISLDVTPRISPDGLINVEVVPTISDLNSWAEVEGHGTQDSVYSKYPVIDIQRLVTDFTMSDGSTAVIGGLTRTTESDVDSGIPYLRKIPWIGPRLFGWKSRQKVQKEIIVFVTVGIADPHNLPEEIGLPKNAVLSRAYVRGEAKEPGDYESEAEMMKLDMTAVDERREKALKQKLQKAKENAAEGPSKKLTSVTEEEASTSTPETAEPASEAEPVVDEASTAVAPEEPAVDAEGPSKTLELESETSPSTSGTTRKVRHGRVG